MNRMPQSSESAQAIAASDALPVERTLAGERDAFRVLVERHSHNVFRLAYRMTRNQHDAEEIVQEAFLRAYQKLGQFAARANFGTWVYRIAANYAIDRMRQKQKEDALAALSHAERTAFVMRHWEGCGIEEIAAVLKLNSSAAKNTVFRAVQKLRLALQPLVGTSTQARAMGTES